MRNAIAAGVAAAVFFAAAPVAGAGMVVLAFGGAVVHVVNERDLGVAASSVAVRLFGALLAGITLLGAGFAVAWFLLAKPPDDGNTQQSFGLSFGSKF